LKRHVPSYTGGHINVNVKPVEGVIAAYLAKYMSKGKQMIAEALEDWGEENCPRTWYNLTKPARELVKSHTHQGRVTGQLLDTMLQFAWNIGIDEVYAFIRRIEMEYDGRVFTVGWRGRFCDRIANDVRDMLESRHMARFAG